MQICYTDASEVTTLWRYTNMLIIIIIIIYAKKNYLIDVDSIESMDTPN